MNSETFANPDSAGQIAPTVRTFAVPLDSTPFGARLARLRCVERLDDWGFPPHHPASEAAALVVAELSGNAVLHAHRPLAPTFRGRMTLGPGFDERPLLYRVLRIEVTDHVGDRPVPQNPAAADPDAPHGRGLLRVSTFAARWGSAVHDSDTKTVWAELDIEQGKGWGSGQTQARSTIVFEGDSRT